MQPLEYRIEWSAFELVVVGPAIRAGHEDGRVGRVERELAQAGEPLWTCNPRHLFLCGEIPAGLECIEGLKVCGADARKQLVDLGLVRRTGLCEDNTTLCVGKGVFPAEVSWFGLDV